VLTVSGLLAETIIKVFADQLVAAISEEKPALLEVESHTDCSPKPG
jgi:hypothetical protein